jgi:hypothetical protein
VIFLEIDIIYELSPSAWNKKGFFLQTDFLKRKQMMIHLKMEKLTELKGRVLWENLS